MNAHDLVTSKRGGPGPYRAVEPRIIIIIIIKVRTREENIKIKINK
jgi:hypothetical protein